PLPATANLDRIKTELAQKIDALQKLKADVAVLQKQVRAIDLPHFLSAKLRAEFLAVIASTETIVSQQALDAARAIISDWQGTFALYRVMEETLRDLQKDLQRMTPGNFAETSALQKEFLQLETSIQQGIPKEAVRNMTQRLDALGGKIEEIDGKVKIAHQKKKELLKQEKELHEAVEQCVHLRQRVNDNGVLQHYFKDVFSTFTIAKWQRLETSSQGIEKERGVDAAILRFDETSAEVLSATKAVEKENGVLQKVIDSKAAFEKLEKYAKEIQNYSTQSTVPVRLQEMFAHDAAQLRHDLQNTADDISRALPTIESIQKAEIQTLQKFVKEASIDNLQALLSIPWVRDVGQEKQVAATLFAKVSDEFA
ncbi:MAG TPA: hypothetical protein VN457_04485, partial [Chlamydiales bacterium]|nr:hypothetical protein [Chlamydiales bacterium]